MTKLRAAIDIGTHTARLLIASDPGPTEQLKALARKRAYIRLAEDFDYSKKKIIQPEAVDRTLNALKIFLEDIKSFNVHAIHAIATGVVREAENRDEFLARIYKQSGIQAKLVTGDEEARLVAKGVLHALGDQTRPFLIFDLGGGTTEFFYSNDNAPTVKSSPLGAMILTKEHIKSDPPEDEQIESLLKHIDQHLGNSFLDFDVKADSLFVVGTGGAVTTLALMLHGISIEDISANRINGLVLKREDIEALFESMRLMSFNERLRIPGLDKGRAGIILAGTLVVIRILFFLKALRLTVSLSDLLEGILLNHFKGENNEQQSHSVCLHFR